MGMHTHKRKSKTMLRRVTWKNMTTGHCHIILFEVEWESVLGTHNSSKCTAVDLVPALSLLVLRTLSKLFNVPEPSRFPALKIPFVCVCFMAMVGSICSQPPHSQWNDNMQGQVPGGFNLNHRVLNKSGWRIWQREVGEFLLASKNPLSLNPR